MRYNALLPAAAPPLHHVMLLRNCEYMPLVWAAQVNVKSAETIGHLQDEIHALKTQVCSHRLHSQRDGLCSHDVHLCR